MGGFPDSLFSDMAIYCCSCIGPHGLVTAREHLDIFDDQANPMIQTLFPNNKDNAGTVQ
jgi:hypothetical protein